MCSAKAGLRFGSFETRRATVFRAGAGGRSTEHRKVGAAQVLVDTVRETVQAICVTTCATTCKRWPLACQARRGATARMGVR